MSKKIVHILLFSFLFFFFACNPTHQEEDVRGWTTLTSDSLSNERLIEAAAGYNINHLQLSHHLVMNLKDLKIESRREKVNYFARRAHSAGIENVFVWDHTLYPLGYYPEEFRSAPGGKINLDNPAFWNWFKQDYRLMLGLIPDVDGIILTFIETGAHVEDQYSVRLSSEEEKLAAIVDSMASVVIDEFGKELFIRTFIYTRAELSSLLKSINLVSHPEVKVMTKEVPHDFFLTHPVAEFVPDIQRPVLIEFDAAHEYNGQGIIASIFPETHLERLRYYQQFPNFNGYVARTDRYNNTSIIGTPSEVNLYALKRGMEDENITAGKIRREFISMKYGEKAVPALSEAFEKASQAIRSIFYTLGLNTNTHSRLDYEDDSGYQRHVSAKWLKDPVIHIDHNVGRDFHYWSDVVNHLAPAWYKGEESNQLAVESHWVLDSMWLKPVEMMNREYLDYIITEKNYGLDMAYEALLLVNSVDSLVKDREAYDVLRTVFERTYFTARLYTATAKAYYGYRVWARGGEHATEEVRRIVEEAMEQIEDLVPLYLNYPAKGPVGQFDWEEDIFRAMVYYNYLKGGLDQPYQSRVFGFIPYRGLSEKQKKEIYRKYSLNKEN